MIPHFEMRCFFSRLLGALFLLFISFPVFAFEPVNLCGRDIYIRQGFDAAWTNMLPSEGPAWKRFEGNSAGRRLRISDMNLPGMPHHSFLSFSTHKPETFTFVSSFDLSASDLASAPLFGLNLPMIGINWEIFINGSPVRKEVYLSEDGSISVYRHSMSIVPVDVRLLHEGENIIAYRIIGDPSLKLTGFYRQKDYLFGSFSDLNSRYGMKSISALIFLYFIIGMFAVLVYLFGRRAEKYILFYGLLTLVVGSYIFFRTPFSYAFFKDSRIVMTAEFLSLFLITPTVGFMFDCFIASEISLFTKIYSAFCILCSAALVASPVTVNFDILLIWQVSSILPIIYYPRMIIVKGVLPDYRKFDAAVLCEKPFARRFVVLRSTMFESYSGILIIGIVVCTSTFVIDIIDAMLFSGGLMLTRYGLFGFTMSMGFLIAAKYNSLHRALEKLNVELKEKIVTINESNSRLTLSEEKYRFLVDYSADFVFILNTDGSFLSANNALLKSMRIYSGDLITHSFFDLLFQDENENNIDNTLIHNNFIEMVENKGKTKFKAKFRTPGVLSDPKAFTVFLDYTAMDGRELILGKAVHAGEDTLQDFFLSERQKYCMNNYLFSAEQMSQRIAGHAEKYLSREDLESFRITLREILINAIEHGNLGITYQEKTEAMENDRYFEFLKERQCDPEYRLRRVEVEYSIDETKIVCKVTDDGQGFDHRAMMTDRASKANDEMLEHGRGLTMANNFFDKISFNEKGNQILVAKFLVSRSETEGAV